MRTIYFDIETETREDAALFLKPIKSPANYKDPEKIKAYIAEATNDALAGGALDAMTARIIAIGLMTVRNDGDMLRTNYDAMVVSGKVCEKDMLRWFVDLVKAAYPGVRLVGWNSEGFDLPMIAKRCAVHDIKFPVCLRQGSKYWSRDCSLDLMQMWKAGDREGQASLNSVGIILGLGGKKGSGSDFARLLREDHDKAMEYLRRDVELLKLIHDRIGG